MSKPKPYIGFTGVYSEHEANAIINRFEGNGITMQSHHVPMVGVLVSDKTLRREKTENARYARVNEITDIFQVTNGRAINMIHYNNHKETKLAEEVINLFLGENLYENSENKPYTLEDFCNAIQFNVTWPRVEQLKKIKEFFPEMQMVFSVNSEILGNLNAKNISDNIEKKYSGLIDYVLFDVSGGRGLVPGNNTLNKYFKVYNLLSDKLSEVTFIFAGGINGKNVGEKVMEVYNQIGTYDFGIDAEGGLRTPIDEKNPGYGKDLLNISRFERYAKNAGIVFDKIMKEETI